MLFNALGSILLVLIPSVQTKWIYIDGNQCRTDEDCAGVVPNRLCRKSDGVFSCVDVVRSRRQNNFESSGTRMLGEECQANDECRRTPVDGTKVCAANLCQCSVGYVPIDAYRCIRDFVQPPAPDTQTSKSVEVKESPGYGSLCTTNEDCQHVTVQLECFRGECACLEGYVPLGKYLCYNIRGQGAPVVESSTINSPTPTDHPATPSAYYRSLLGGQCRSSESCQTTDAQCLNQICACPAGSFPIDEWNCLAELDSTQLSTSTAFHWWPWTLSSTTLQSRLVSKETVRPQCILNRQCLSIDQNSHCSLGRCVCNSGYELDLTSSPQRCVRRLINEDNCD